MRWSGATDATARCKSRSTGCARKRRSVRVLPWICGVKPKPKVVNKPSHHFIMHGLDNPVYLLQSRKNLRSDLDAPIERHYAALAAIIERRRAATIDEVIRTLNPT